uniref:protein phosphatase 1 regulatory subunit 3D-like n=1 Tax=Oncorhynchus gorbuscha TaxID=8017 RepID=UPI001EAE9D64|nr:protein phosphatase 1 regulatory subunit 3D-like [Oncorhynchus gorbuscha]XP_046190281.1 protein phosphatase 1 regulatory subunit 3D-like [Oncorhynchus gorbuscha]
MDWTIGKERIPSCNSELPKASKNASGTNLTINLNEMLRSKAAVERKRVPIRPPNPRAPAPRELEFSRGLSCEPMPKPIIRRRARSLSSSTEWKRHTRNVGVRFVDCLGLDLEDVKVFKTGEDPFVPQHVSFRLLMGAELAGGKNLEISLPYLKPVFPQQPGDRPEFFSRLRQQRVCLERVLCFDLGIIGITQVLNLHFEKEVSVRYSFTGWRCSSETKASWVSTTCNSWDGTQEQLNCDTFRFHLPVPPFLLPGAALEFAVRYKVSGKEHWDNNEGQNYKLVCHSYKLTVPKECEHSMVHFI